MNTWDSMRMKFIAAFIITVGFASFCDVVAKADETSIVPAEAVARAEAFFIAALGDERQLPVVLKGLQSTGDAELLPVFAAICKSGDKERRLLASAMIDKVAGQAAAPALLDRLFHDPSMAVRSTALIRLAAIEAITPEQLIAATKIDDEGVQIIAARALVRARRSDAAKAVLKKLAKSRDADTAALARMSLLAGGDQTQIGPLRKVILDPATKPARLIRMLDQIRLEKIAAALPVAQFLAKPDQLQSVRVRALQAIDALSPKAGPALAQAIRTSDSLAFRLNVLRILAQRPDGRELVREFADGPGDDTFAVVARFDLARQAGGDAAQHAVARAIAREHPIVIEYVLTRMQQDVQARGEKADFYTTPILKYLRSVDVNPGQMSPINGRAAMAVQILGELDSPDARKGLWDILAQPDTNPLKQLTAGALYRCKNRQIASLLRPSLGSPFPNLRIYSALLLGRAGRTSAIPALLRLQELSRQNQADVLTLANWYLLKMSGQSKQTVEKLVQSIK